MARAKWIAEDWDGSQNAEDMLRALRGRRRNDGRALRLLSSRSASASAAWSRTRDALPPWTRHAYEPLGREARRSAKAPALAAVRQLMERSLAADESGPGYWQGAMIVEASTAFAKSLDAAPLAGALAVSVQMAEAAAWELVRQFGGDGWEEAREAELLIHADLLRHIVGNPFRPVPALPAKVIRLAEALEAGEPVSFALRDAAQMP